MENISGVHSVADTVTVEVVTCAGGKVTVVHKVKEENHDEENQGTKQGLKSKHPDMPKKPLTPYVRYYLEKIEKYSKDNPEMSVPDLDKLLSQKFQKLKDEKKQKYKEAYEKEDETYKKELKKFKKAHPELVQMLKMRQQAAASVAEGPDYSLHKIRKKEKL